MRKLIIILFLAPLWYSSISQVITLIQPGSTQGTITVNSVSTTKIKATGTPSATTFLRGDSSWATISASVNWGNVGGTLSNQSDLQTALNLKLNISDSAAMLLPYLRKFDTTAMLSPYLRSTVASATYATITGLNGKQATITQGTTAQYLRGDLSLATFPTTTASFVNSTDKNFVTDAKLTVVNNTTGTNSGDNATNSQYSGLVSNATHTGDATGSTALTVVKINGTSLAALATGILKNTTGTGIPSIAVAGDFPTLNQSTTGSAATLTTSRNINGVAFNGSADITVTADANTLSNTTLKSTVVTSSLTTIGTLIAGAVPTTLLTGTITNAQLAGSIAASKLVGSDIATVGTLSAGAIPTTLLTGTITNAQLAGSIAYSKLILTGAILNADLAGSIDLTTKVTGILPFANNAGTTAATSATTGSMTVNLTTPIITITPSGACTFNGSGGVTGQRTTFVITTSGASSFVLTWGTNFRTTATLATGTTTAKIFAVTFLCLNGTTWIEISRTAAM